MVLKPDVPLALELLPINVRDLIGKPHPHSAPAMALLQKEGFTFENYINSDTYMVATVDKNFSACLGELLFTENNHVIITQHTADILNIQLGDTLRISL